MPLLHKSHRLVIVTGKGGVGKTVLAAALAGLSARQGLRTVLVTLDTRDQRHALLGVPLAYRPHAAPRGFAVSRVDAFEAVAEYTRRNVPFGGLYQAFFKSRAFQDFASAAPGFEEIMSLGKLYDLATGRDYDRVIFDAPSTGHLKELLAVPAVIQRAVRVGPLNHNARKIEDLLLDPDRTRVVVAALAEEMPVQEALELVDLCRARMRMSVAPLLVNRRVSRRFSRGEVAAMEALAAAGSLTGAGRGALAVAREEAALADSQWEALAPVRAAGLATVEVPRVANRTGGADRLLDEVEWYLGGVVGGGEASRSGDRSHSSHRWDRSHRSGGSHGSDRAASAGPVAGPVELDVARLVRDHRIIICCGSGGVGKTTTAAALGVLAARRGLRVQVMTIDPARRLAQAMGLDALSHDPQQVPVNGPGELWAMMLDSKRAFDRLVETYAPDPRVREAIFANHYYQQLSTSLGGSRELAAMERVLEVAQDGGQDLLIVDTPPSQHALDFLDAPERLVKVLDGAMTGWLVRPYGLAARAQFSLFRQSSGAALKFMERLLGVQMLADLSDFLLAFSSMFEGFKERSHRVRELMRQPTTGFLLVSAPEPASLDQADRFAARLEQEAMHVAGMLANRVHMPPPGAVGQAPERAVLGLAEGELVALAEAGEPGFSEIPLPDRLTRAWQEAVDLSLADQAALAGFRRGTIGFHAVPRFPHDLHSMNDLEDFAATLLAPPPAVGAIVSRRPGPAAT